MIYAMAGGRIRHHRIATNALVALASQMRGRKCEAFNSDMKVRVRFPTHTRFYYPDAQVVRRSGPPDQTFQDEPVVVIEVISEDSRRTDEQEKREAYLSLPSVDAYLLIEQNRAAVTVWRRSSSGFETEWWQGLNATVTLPTMDATLPLGEVYNGVEFLSDRANDREDELSPG